MITIGDTAADREAPAPTDGGRAAPPEADPDAVFGIAQAFCAETLDACVSNECYADHKGEYVHLFIGGYPADGFDADYALARAAEIGEAVREMGWFVAKAEIVVADDAEGHLAAVADGEDSEPQTMCFVDLFPNEGRLHDQVHGIVWHASPKENREAILKDGLRPATGGNDHIVLPRPRIYACIHAMFLEWIEQDMRMNRRWSELDLWRVDLSAIHDHKWRRDVEMENISAWTDAAIPPEALALEGSLVNMANGGWRRLESTNRVETA